MSQTSALVYGGDLMLFANSGTSVQPLAFSTSAKLSVSMKTRDVSSKDSGDFLEKAAGKFEWSVSSDQLLNWSTTGTTQSADEVYNYFICKKLMNVQFGSKTGTSPSYTVSGTAKKFTGCAYITSYDINSGDGETATYSINLEGTGALSIS